MQLPYSRSLEVIALELQNAELLKHLGAAPVAMRHQRLLEQSYAKNLELLQRKQQLSMRREVYKRIICLYLIVHISSIHKINI